jgi:hypothetical protein
MMNYDFNYVLCLIKKIFFTEISNFFCYDILPIYFDNFSNIKTSCQFYNFLPNNNMHLNRH